VNRQAARYAGPAHLLTIAPTRTGKGVGTIIPNLLTIRSRSSASTPRARMPGSPPASAQVRRGPCPRSLRRHGLASAAFNPLDRIDPAGLDLADDCMTLADAGPRRARRSRRGALERGSQGADRRYPAPRRHDRAARHSHLDTLRDRLTLAPAASRRSSRHAGASGLAARAANRHLGKSDREAAGVLSAAQRHTHFLDSPRMATVLGGSDFTFAGLKERRHRVPVLPPDRLATYARWLRLMVAQALTDWRARRPATRPVLFLLDEFAALGRLEPVERAMGLMAGYGLQLWPILQDVHQLRALYGRRAGTFLSNAGVLQVFGVNDHDSAKLVSDLAGQETVVFETMSRAIDAEETGLSFGQQHVGRALLTPMKSAHCADRQLLFLAGQRPIIAAKLRYYADREFAGRFDPA
jgi:type IV secretion system protein VirD4